MKSMKVKDSLTICNKLKKKSIHSDIKTKPVRLPPLASTSKKTRELSEIQALPSDWEPDTRPSKVIEKLMKKRKEEHEKVLEKMRNAMSDVNTEIEDDIRVASVLYKQGVKDSKKEINDCLQNIRQILKGPAELALSHFSIVVDDIISIYRSNKHRLFNLLQKLKRLERSRAVAFKGILTEAYTKLNQICYKLPYEIQQFFEEEIQAINETTLSNIRGYTELKAHLKLQLQNEIRLCLHEIQYLKENWFYYIKYTLFTTLNRDKLFGKNCNQEALEINTADSDDRCSTCTDWGNESTINVHKMFQWVNKIKDVMNHVDVCATKIVGSFKEAVIKVVGSYFDDMKRAVQTILDLGIIEKWEVKTVQTEFCGQALVDATGKYTEELAKLQDLWAESKRELQSCLEDAFVFLEIFSGIWSMHFDRLNQIKDIVAKDLQREMRDGFLSVCAEETKINIKIDSLRQESNRKVLEEGTGNVARCLDNLKDLYIQNQQRESLVVENITDLARMEAELLEAELIYFLNCNYGHAVPISDKATKTSIPEVTSKGDEIEAAASETNTAKTLLAAEIRQCKRQFHLLQHWKSGLQTIILSCKNKCKEEIGELANRWINAEKRKSVLRLGIIEVMHASRYDRLNALITDIRLTEIEENDKRFREHKAGIEQEISNLTTIFPRYETKYKQILEDCENVVDQIKNRTVNAKNSAIVTSELSCFQTTITSSINKLAKINETYQTDVKLRICEILKTNLLYLKALKLFSEDGNFCLTTSKDICNELSKMEKRYKKEINSVSRDNDKKYSQCLQSLDDIKLKTHDFLAKYEGELKHCDNCIYAFKEIQLDLKREVYQIKFKGKQLRSTLANLWEIGEKGIGQSEKLQYFIQHAKKCMEMIEECEDMLKRSLTGKGEGNLSKLKFERMSSVIGTTSLSYTIGKLQNKIKSSSGCSDYSSYLFDVPPIKEECFIGKTRYLLYTSYHNVQRDAKDFYENHSQATIQTDKIHGSYQEFVSDTLPKYMYYYIQCELIWLEEANAFLQTIDEILPNLRKLRNNSLRKYVEIHFEELKEAFHICTCELNDKKSRSKTEFFSLYKKLMPLHGYPRNTALLEGLNEQMQNFFKEKAEDYVDPVKTYQEQFHDKELQYTVGLFQINDSLEVLETLYEEKLYSKRITSEFLETLLRLQKFVVLPWEINQRDTVLQEAAKKLEFYKENIVVPPEYLLSVSASSLLCNTPTNEHNSSTDLRNINVINEIEQYTKEKEEIIENIMSIVNENEFDVTIWKNMWDKAVENVIGLYKVKYDQPDSQ